MRSGGWRLDARGWNGPILRGFFTLGRLPRPRREARRGGQRRGIRNLLGGELFGGEFGACGAEFLFVVEDALADFGRKITRLAKRVRRGTTEHGGSPLRFSFSGRDRQRRAEHLRGPKRSVMQKVDYYKGKERSREKGQ